MRNKNTIDFLGIWEEMYNIDFNVTAYEEIMLEAGLKGHQITIRIGKYQFHATIRKRSVMLPFSINRQHISGTATARNSMRGRAAHRGARV